MSGIEPPYTAWEAAILPLNYTRDTYRAPAQYQSARGALIILIEILYVTDLLKSRYSKFTASSKLQAVNLQFKA